MRSLLFRLPKITRNMMGKTNANPAAAGLRQNWRCSLRTWRATRPASRFINALLSELQVHILQARAGDGESLERGFARERPARERVKDRHGVIGFERGDSVVQRDADRKVGERGAGREFEANERTPRLAAAEFIWRAFGDDAAACHNDDAICKVLGLIHVVGRE